MEGKDDPTICALISTYKEHDLLRSVLLSAADLDDILVFDGSTNNPNAEDDTYKLDQRADHAPVPYAYFYGSWRSDAHKRSEMLFEAKCLGHDWALWLDGDEILLWGQYLHDFVRRADQETATGGTTIRIVEYDGSVAMCYGKLIKPANIRSYDMSSYEITLENGMTVALPNVPICYAGGIPYGNVSKWNDPLLAINRPPLQGEPHLLHRHGLRDPNRGVERLHDAERDSFADMVQTAGLSGVEIMAQQNTEGKQNG